MIKSGFTPCLPVVRPKFQFLVRSKLFFCLIMTALMGSFGAVTAPAQQGDQPPNPDEQYIRIMATIDKADALRKAGQIPAAVTRYREAQTNLVRFKFYNPLYDPKTVQYRLDEVTGRIDALTAPPERPSASSTNQTELTAAPAPKSPVKLIDAGAEPRKTLRFKVQAGDKESVLLTMRSVVQNSINGTTPTQIPAITLPMDATVKTVNSANGDITYEFVVNDVTVAEDTNVTPQVAQDTKTIATGLKGTTVTGVMSDRGISKKVDVKPPAGATPQVVQTAEQLKSGFSPDAAFPEEAVGPGAKWEVQKSPKVQGLVSQLHESYQLVSFDGDHVNISVTVDASSTNQVAQITSASSGTNMVDLTKIVPLQGAWTTHDERNSNIPGKGPVAFKSDSSFVLESK